MAVKRTAHAAFGKEIGKLSAFAAAKLARGQPKTQSNEQTSRQTEAAEAASLHNGRIVREDVDTGFDSIEPQIVPAKIRYTSSSVRPVTGTGSSESVTYTLHTNDSLLIVGEYTIQVTDGAVSVYGALLRKGSVEHVISALSTNAIPRIVSRSSNTRLTLRSMSTHTSKLEKLSQLFRNIGSRTDDGRTFTVLYDSQSDSLQRSLHELEESSELQRTISQLCAAAETQHVSTICIGPKSSGKSTMTRMLCNALQTRSQAKSCLYLDLDPGQPEFGPPGQLSLVEVSAPVLGPPYTHTARTSSKDYRLICAHSLAATSFKDSPQHYLRCVQHLLNHPATTAARRSSQSPVIINSCGWINGIGAKMLDAILDLKTSHAVLLDVGDQSLLQSVQAKVPTSFLLSRAAIRQSSRSPGQLRQMQAMAYFHNPAIEQCIVAIDSWRPWVLSYDDDGTIAAIVSYGQAFNTDFLTEVLDGTIVAVVTSRLEAAESSSAGETAISASSIMRVSHGLPHLFAPDGLDPELFYYHGLGFIRSIDESSKRIQLLLPSEEHEAAAVLQQRVYLIRGAFDTPDWAYLERSPRDESATPWLQRQEMVGIESAVWRLRHPPTASQLAGKR